MMGDDWYMFGDWDLDSIIVTDKSKDTSPL